MFHNQINLEGGLNVVSLFDGMSCAQLALQRAGIKVKSYRASELDKFAIQVTQKNFPDTIQMGDVTKIDYHRLNDIDLLVAGSPCQGFSFAGKQLNFKDPRSRLFFVFFSAWKQMRPKYFLLENVKMKKEYQDVISAYMGVEPVMLDSNLVSAQNRKRLYWTNIPGIAAPVDRGIKLDDIIEHNVLVPNSESWHRWFELNKDEQLRKSYSTIMNKVEKSITLTARQVTSWTGNIYCLTEHRSEEGRKIRAEHRAATGRDYSPRKFQELIPRNDGKANCLTTDLTQQHVICQNQKYRFLTPVEAERLQTVPDGYTDCVSNYQRYKMLGNGFTVDMIAHLLSQIKNPTCAGVLKIS